MASNYTQEIYCVEENGGYVEYSKASQNGLSQILKTSCKFDEPIKSYFKGNTLVEENDTSNIQDTVTTRIK